MLTVQMMIGSTEVDRKNGSSQSKYHGYTTGAQSIAAAIGQANASDGHGPDLLLSQIAVRMPTRTANPATTSGDPTCSSATNTGPLKRKLLTYAPNDPIGTSPSRRNGTYRSPNTPAASAAYR